MNPLRSWLKTAISQVQEYPGSTNRRKSEPAGAFGHLRSGHPGSTHTPVPSVSMNMLSGVQSILDGAQETAEGACSDIASAVPNTDISSSVPNLDLGNAKMDTSFRPSTGSSEIIAERMSAALMAPPMLSPREQQRHENGEILQDESAHRLMQMSSSRISATIKSGTIVFSWNQSNQRKVPYWLVPDGLADDPFFVEKVLQAMKLPAPNLILRFSRLKQVTGSGGGGGAEVAEGVDDLRWSRGVFGVCDSFAVVLAE